MRVFNTKIGLGSIFLLLWISGVSAHEVEVSNNIGSTFHIEPNDSPKASVPSKAWFVLTQKGGTIIPLSKCQGCELTVYPSPYKKGKTSPLLKPKLSAARVDQYSGIPGAMITFPKPGKYELNFNGTAQLESHTQRFSFTYDVIVNP